MFLFIPLEAHENHKLQDLTFNKASRLILNRGFFYLYFCVNGTTKGAGACTFLVAVGR